MGFLGQCLGKTEKLEKGKGIIEWKSTAMGQVSLAACPFGSQSLYSVQQLEKGAGFAQRDCMLVDRMDGKEAQWDVPNTDNCDPVSILAQWVTICLRFALSKTRSCEFE